MMLKESPLKGMIAGNNATVTIRELADIHTIDLRVTPGSPSYDTIAQSLDIDLTQPGKTSTNLVSSAGEIYALCLAPDWWLILGYKDAQQSLSQLQANNDYHFSLVNVSGQRTTIELEGPNAREVLAHLWEQDLREKSFPVGAVSQGLMAKAPVIVWHIAPFRYRIMVRSSFALHVWKCLVDAAEELG
ncbi:MAG: sarcosine oxidase subunit gamma family protein [Chitinophagaceae bacterium]